MSNKSHKATPEQWAEVQERAEDCQGGPACILELRARVEALEATMPMVLQPLTEVREFIPAPVTHDMTNAAPLLWVLWNHLGGSSSIGQPIREYLGMGQFERMTEEQIEAAKQYRDCMAMPTTPSPAGSLVERVRGIIGLDPVDDGKARAVIREVAAALLEQEATR